MTYKLFKQKTKFSLHQAIRMKREDVLFLYLIDNDADVRNKEKENFFEIFFF
jgi:DNA-dependent RNA polymerase auxiliary subunit epsilon